MTINMKRGFFRLWVVATVLWVVLAFVYEWMLWTWETDPVPDWSRAAWVAFIPPLVLLALGAVLGWALSGFRKD